MLPLQNSIGLSRLMPNPFPLEPCRGRLLLEIGRVDQALSDFDSRVNTIRNLGVQPTT